ncbi:periplasmic sensor signal transduction histidine kinase [Caballeronia catudaia]|uniref:histidine kinase n=2 Tax=Caballeronia catudaia TaxID=1777136 RepID=A0A158DN41_9BURK|nr:periplasmic sensor signal transduction histidine kinase [Caballeronia catudaia]
MEAIDNDRFDTAARRSAGVTVILRRGCLRAMLHLDLRMRLMAWLLVPLATFILVTGWTSYDSAQHTAELIQDSTLLSSARTIIEDIDWVDGGLAVSIPPAALELFESAYQDQVFYKVVSGHDKLLSGNPDLPTPRQVGTQPVFFDATLEQTPIRAVAFSRELYDSGKAERVLVIVGKTQASRHGLLADLWRPQLIRECLMLAFVAVLIPLGLAVELRPLTKLRDDVAGRQALQIETIHAERLPRELRLIVDAINQCISQLKLHAVRQRQFIADAAHQLRTPLALLDAQIQYALRADRDEEKAWDALLGARRSTEKMKNATAQLLLLAQAESAPRRARSRTDVAAVVASVLEELIIAAQRRDIDLGAEFDGDSVVAGNRELLGALVSNLVDNAIRYTQQGGTVTAVVRREGAAVVLQVVDDGPGIAAKDSVLVFERFYRASTSTEGTGLGLPIVREIARLHGGDIDLAPGPDGTGLSVTVRFPAWIREEGHDETIVG